jgi:ATP/maltotriose-dependent transcriptional regulator MalT
MAGELGRGLELARRAEAVLGDASGPLAVCIATVRTNFAIITGEVGAAARLDRRPDPLEALASADSLMWHRVAWAIQTSTWADRPAEAVALAESLIGMGRAHSTPSLLPFPLAARAEARVVIGDWDGAYSSGTSALELALETGHQSTAAFARCTLARIDAARGRDEQCRELIAAVIESLADHEARAIASYAHAVLGLLELGAGRLDAALTELQRTHDAALTQGLACHGAIPYLPDLIEAAIKAGRREVAAEALAHLKVAARPGYLRTAGAYERCSGLLADDHETAVTNFRAAIGWEAKAGVPFERARSQLLLGERLRRIRRRAEAKEALLQAYATFDTLGAVPWAARAGEGLGALGVRPRPNGAARSADLTPQELQVSRGAARGLSNREIAGLLFLSVKTVEFHLHNAYAKLGVRSRTELTARMLAPTAPDAVAPADEHPDG